MTTTEQQNYIDLIADSGRYWAWASRLPLPAMIACAIEESGWGKGKGPHLRTGVPYNLQKPSGWSHPTCETERNSTINKDGEKARPSPFCVATNLAEAAMYWCQWCRLTPLPGRRTLLTYIDRPVLFAKHLSLVGFSNSDPTKGTKYSDHVRNHDLNQPKFDAGQADDGIFEAFLNGHLFGLKPDDYRISIDAQSMNSPYQIWINDRSVLQNWYSPSVRFGSTL